jgi:hypothetical protein
MMTTKALFEILAVTMALTVPLQTRTLHEHIEDGSKQWSRTFVLVTLL